MSGLTEFQPEVARLFFAQPASDGFLFAGAGALLVCDLTTRRTEDLDFFGERDGADIAAARDEFEVAATQRNWQVDRVQDSETFVRLHVHGEGEVIVDIAIDAPAEHPPAMSDVGPTFDPEELAGPKLVALFSRAEARDFADVFALAQRFDLGVLLDRAAEVDLGFDHGVIAQTLRTIDRFTDDEVPIEQTDVDAVRVFFRAWADQLEQHSE